MRASGFVSWNTPEQRISKKQYQTYGVGGTLTNVSYCSVMCGCPHQGEDEGSPTLSRGTLSNVQEEQSVERKRCTEDEHESNKNNKASATKCNGKNWNGDHLLRPRGVRRNRRPVLLLDNAMLCFKRWAHLEDASHAL